MNQSEMGSVTAFEEEAQYRRQLYRLQRDPKLRQQYKQLLCIALNKVPTAEHPDDRRRTNLAHSVAILFKWVFFKAFEVNERMDWADPIQKSNQGGWLKTWRREIERKTKLTYADVRYSLSALKTAGLLATDHDRDPLTNRVIAFLIRPVPERLIELQRAYPAWRLSQKALKPKPKRRRLSSPLAIGFGIPTPNYLRELDLARRVSHHSNYRECLVDAIRFHSQKSVARSQEPDRRQARSPKGHELFAIGMVKMFAPDQAGRREAIRRFDRLGRRLTTIEEMMQVARCTHAQYRRAVDFYKAHGIYDRDMKATGAPDGLWVTWKFEEFIRFLESVERSKFLLFKEKPRLVLVTDDRKPRRRSSRTAAEAREEILESSATLVQADLRSGMIDSVLSTLSSNKEALPSLPADARLPSGTIKKEEWASPDTSFPFVVPDPEHMTPEAHPHHAQVQPAESIAFGPGDPDHSPREQPASIVSSPGSDAFFQNQLASSPPARFVPALFPDFPVPAEAREWWDQALARHLEQEDRLSRRTPVPEELLDLERSLESQGEGVDNRGPLPRTRSLRLDFIREHFAVGGKFAALPPVLRCYEKWWAKEEEAQRAHEEKTKTLSIPLDLPKLHVPGNEQPNGEVAPWLQRFARYVKESTIRSLFPGPIPAGKADGSCVEFTALAPGIVVEVPETVAFLAAWIQNRINNFESIALSNLLKIWKLNEENSLTPEMLAEYFEGQEWDLFRDKLAWMGNCPLEVFLGGWRRIRIVLDRARRERSGLKFLESLKGADLDFLKSIPEWFDEGVKRFAASPQLEKGNAESVLFCFGHRVGTGEPWDDLKAAYSGLVGEALHERPVLYHFLHKKIPLDSFCELKPLDWLRLLKAAKQAFQNAANAAAYMTDVHENQSRQAREEAGEVAVQAESEAPLVPEVSAEEWLPTAQEAVPCSLSGLNEALGGGFVPGETALICGCSGFGKTLTVSQLALDFAKLNKRVLFILTETEEKMNIYPRMASNFFNIPYGLVLAKAPEGNALLAGQPSEAIELFVSLFNQQMNFVNLDKSRQDLTRDLDALAHEFRPDVVVIDGLLEAISPAHRGGDYRDHLLAALESFREHGQRHERTMLITTHLNVGTALNRRTVTPAMMLHIPGETGLVDTWIGLTGLRDQESFMVERAQFMAVYKTAHGPGGKVPVLAEFEFQRFRDIEKPKVIS